MSNTLLIDTDVLCYLFAFRNTDTWSWDDDGEVAERTLPEKALAETSIFVDDLREKLKGDEVYFILSDRHENFRKSLEPTYKQGRHRKRKPTLWATIRDFIEFGKHGYPVRQLPRLEGDDVLGMMATHPKRGKKAVVVSIDKDMRTVPSRLYLFNHPDDGVLHIDPEDAHRFHMTQVLTGDAVDEYTGIPGVGPKKAEARLEGVPAAQLWDAVVDTYHDYNLTEKDALLQARLAYILQHGDYTRGKIRLWKPTRTKL